MYTVTIKKEHFTGTFISDNCPLAVAIKEQFPDYPLETVGGLGEIILLDGRERDFYPNPIYLSQGVIRPHEAPYWGYDTYKEIRSSRLKSFEVQITEP